jgi:cyanophycinase
VLELHVTAVAESGDVPATAFAEVDGIVIGGGRTPAYRELLEPHFGELRRQIAAGVPYLGCSAGAAIAAERAIIGGWRIGGVAVTPEATSEGLDEVTVAPGIGLVDVAIDAHAAQWGTVSRLIAAVEAGLVEGGLAIDERTALVVGEGGLGVAGDGSVWRVLPGESGVVVSTMGA